MSATKTAVPHPQPDLTEQDADRRIARQLLADRRHAINTEARLLAIHMGKEFKL